MKNFKFIIHKPLRNLNSDSYAQYVSIVCTAPYLMFSIPISYKLVDNEDKIRLAKAELKVAIMEALVNGEWEYEQD